MSDVALFDLEEAEWAPVWEPTIEDFGWHWSENPKTHNRLPVHADGSKVTDAEWKQYLVGRCRDCGVRCPFDRGGADSGVSYRVCYDCALLDGARVITHRSARCEPYPQWSWTVAVDCLDCTWTTWTERFVKDGEAFETEPIPAEEIDAQILEHNRARYCCHWGYHHEIAEHDELVRGQQKRRAAYRKATTNSGLAVAELRCVCGHLDVEHHGVDRGDSGGCFGDHRGLLDPERCTCRLTCSDVRKVRS